VVVPLAAAATISAVLAGPQPSGAANAPVATTSHYEYDGDPASLYQQGQEAGTAAAQGLVILDFGRPAFDGSTYGMIDHADGFVSLASVVTAVQSYIRAYFQTAPANTHLYLAIGTNNSCGTGQPCGDIVCGCNYQPPSFSVFGAQLAAIVEQVQSWATSFRSSSGLTDRVTVVAGDDAEPAYDPAYVNTYDLLSGYANAVGGYEPAMVDYGSAEPGYWSESQLLKVANGFAPDVAVPEIYEQIDATEWANLVSYGQNLGEPVTIFGMLGDPTTGTSPELNYSALLNAIEPITGQTTIEWPSNISP
jgi:hypothetical protein